jgi:hypothetical protein
VYWTAGHSGHGVVMKVPLDGGAPTRLASGLSSPTSIAVDDTSVYWADAQSVMKLTPK